MSIYPEGPYMTRILEVGGLTKTQLIEKMHLQSISMNDFAKQLITDERFTTSDIKYSLQTVELNLRNLGFSEGATLSQIYNRLSELQLTCCPLELGPYFRLIYLDQTEGHLGKPMKPNQAPAGSITIASEIISEDDDFPKGFYLRKLMEYYGYEVILWMIHTYGVLMIDLFFVRIKRRHPICIVSPNRVSFKFKPTSLW